MNKKIALIIILLLLCGIGTLIIYNNINGVSSNRIELTKKYYSSSGFIEVDDKFVNNNNDETYLLFTYNNYCSLPISCESIFKSFSEKNNINILKIPYAEFKNTYLYETVKFAPSVIIINNGKIIDYLDANSDDDLEKYQDVKTFKKWVNSYLKI